MSGEMQSLPFLQFTGIILMCHFYPAVDKLSSSLFYGPLSKR
jgi:hypothetical protein